LTAVQDILLLCPTQVCVAKNEPCQTPARSERQMSPVHQRIRASQEGCTQSPGEGAQLSPGRPRLPAMQPPSRTSASCCLELLTLPGLRCGTATGRMLQPCPRAIQQMKKKHHHNCAVELHEVTYEALLALA